MLQSVLRRQLQADPIATRELKWSTGGPGVIDRTDGMYDVLPVEHTATSGGRVDGDRSAGFIRDHRDFGDFFFRFNVWYRYLPSSRRLNG